MRFKDKLDEEMAQSERDRIFLKSAAYQVFGFMRKEIDNYIKNITIPRKDIKAKKIFAFKEIMKNLSKKEKDVF